MKRKCIMAAIVLTLMMVSLEGCGGSPETDSGNTVLPVENGTEEEKLTEDGAVNDAVDEDREDPDETSGTEQAGQDDRAEQTGQKEGTDNGGKGAENLNLNTDLSFIGGIVKSVSSDSFVISRTLIDDEGMVTMPGEGSPEEELVTVRCTDSTVFERWTIQGGGEGIDRTEASFSEIKADDGLEAQGSFDGEEFIAEKVIIEVYQ